MSDEKDQKICRRDFIRNTAITGLSAFVMAGLFQRYSVSRSKRNPIRFKVKFHLSRYRMSESR